MFTLPFQCLTYIIHTYNMERHNIQHHDIPDDVWMLCVPRLDDPLSLCCSPLLAGLGRQHCCPHRGRGLRSEPRVVRTGGSPLHRRRSAGGRRRAAVVAVVAEARPLATRLTRWAP